MIKQIFPIILSVLFACGPSAEERAKIQKEREDSIRIAIENTTRLRLEKKFSLIEELENAETIKEGLENRLMYLRGELEVQNDKLGRIKQPQFLRTPYEREQQIRAQMITIEQFKKDIIDLHDKLSSVAQSINDLRTELKLYK